MRSAVFTMLLFASALSVFAQNVAGAWQVKAPFQIPREEKIEFFKPTSTAAPVILSTTDEALFIRPMDMSTGQPLKTLAIRSNETKKIDLYALAGDSIFALVRTEQNGQTTAHEAVIYTLTGNELGQAHRHTIALPETHGKRNINELFFTVSKSGKRLAVVQQDVYLPSPTRASVFVEVASFPDDSIEHFSLPMPFDADDLQILGASVDDSGTVYFGAKTGIKLNSPFLRKYLVYAFSPRLQEMHEYDLSVDKKYVQDITLKVEGTQLYIVALFAEDPFAQGNSSGYLFVQLDSSGTRISQRKEVYYSAAVKQAFDAESAQGNKEVSDVFLNNIHTLNGTPVAIMERHYQDQVCTTDPRTGIITCTNQFHHEGILVENLNDPSQSQFIGRNQVDYNKPGPYTGMGSYEVGGSVFVLYNDHHKNESTTADRVMNTANRAVLRYVEVGRGAMRSAPLVADDQNDYIYLPAATGHVAGGKIAVLLSNGRDFRVGEIDTYQTK